MKILKSELKHIIKEELEQVLLKEATLYSKMVDSGPIVRKLAGVPDHSKRYKGEKGKEVAATERKWKKDWNMHVDRDFINSIKLVHWEISGDPAKFLTSSGKDEISTEGYLPDEPMVSRFAKGTQVGVLIDGYVTFAMNSGGGTGFFAGKDAGEKWKSSGMAKRAGISKALPARFGGGPILNKLTGDESDYLILNKDSVFRRGSGKIYNEFIVDNWKPKALVSKGGADNKFYKELYAIAKKTGLPIIDENGKKVELDDPAERPFGKKLATGIKRVTGGGFPGWAALPENKI